MTTPTKDPVVKKVSNKIKIKNISDRAVNLYAGRVEQGETGIATIAELSTLSKFIEKV